MHGNGWGGLGVLSLWAAFSQGRRGVGSEGVSTESEQDIQAKLGSRRHGEAPCPAPPGLLACSLQGSSTWILGVGQGGGGEVDARAPGMWPRGEAAGCVWLPFQSIKIKLPCLDIYFKSVRASIVAGSRGGGEEE